MLSQHNFALASLPNFSNSASHTPRQFHSPWHVIPGVTAALMGNLGRTTRLWGSDPWTRDTWIVTGDIFQPPPPLLPSPLHHGAFNQRGERRGEAWTLLWPSAPSTTAAAPPMHLPTYNWNPTQTPDFHFRFQIFLLCENLELTLGLNIFRRAGNCR